VIHLYLVRHGVAEDAAAGTPDALRALSAKARKRMRKTARSFARKSGALESILVSPLVRAVQTAEILAGEVKHRALSVLAELAPEHAVDALLKAVGKRAGKKGSIALVGHEPQLSRLLAALTHLPAAQAGKLDIRPGAIVRVDVSGLPQAKKGAARWWLKSGGRHKGLPLKEEKERAAPAKKKEPAKKKSAAKAKKAAPPRKPVAAKAAPTKRPPAKPAPAKAPAKPAATKPPAPAPARPAAPSGPQRFMGTPRPPPPLKPPAPAPAPQPAPVAPPTGDKPPTEGSTE
jgi:phosphohistidine phosphatase SixA